MRKMKKWMSYVLILVLMITMGCFETVETKAAVTETYTIDVTGTIDLSYAVDTTTVRTKSSNLSVASVSNVSLSLPNGNWKADFTVTGISEGTATITLYEVFSNTTYATYEVTVKHSYDDGEIITAANCNTDGVKRYTCTGCGATKTENLGKDPSNHAGTQIVVNAREASCGDGYTGDTVCSACRYVYQYGKTIPAVTDNHTPVIDAAVAPTCTTVGLTEGSHCSVCNTVLVAQTEIPAKGHTEVVDPSVPATKTKTGLTEGRHCSICGAVLVAQQVIPSTIISLAHGVVSKDTTISSQIIVNNDVYVEKGCTLTINDNATINGSVYVFGTIRNSGILTINGTLNALHYGTMMSAGNYDYGYLYNTGQITATSMNITNSFLGKSIPSVTHTWDSGTVTTAATCTSSGIKTYACTVCGDEKTETIAKTNHKYYWYHTDSMGTDGYDLICSVCNKNYNRGYKNSDGYYYMYDSNSNEGYHHLVYDAYANLIRTEKCSISKWTTDDLIHDGSCKCHAIMCDGEEHTKVSEITKASTSKDGKIITKCSVCNEELSSIIIYYPKTVSLSTRTYTYSGFALKPKVTVKDLKGKKISASNYEVSYQSNKNVGIASVIVKFKGSKYSGTIKKTFNINPTPTNIVKLTAVPKGFKAMWKKQTTQINGYEIQYATEKKFKKNAGKTFVKGAKTTSKSIQKLTQNKKYYIRIRTYKTVKGTKYYSTWKVYSKKIEIK